MTNASDIDHQFAVYVLAGQLANFVIQNKLCMVIGAPFEVHLTRRTKPVQSDVLFIKTENWPASGTKEVYTLSGQEYALLGQFIGEEMVQSNVLPGLKLVTHSLFMPGS